MLFDFVSEASMQNSLHQHFLLSVHLFRLQRKSLKTNGLKAETGCFYMQLSRDIKSFGVFYPLE